jgi:hypothetical protein
MGADILNTSHDLNSLMQLDAGNLNAVVILCLDAACCTMIAHILSFVMFTSPNADYYFAAQAMVGAT